MSTTIIETPAILGVEGLYLAGVILARALGQYFGRDKGAVAAKLAFDDDLSRFGEGIRDDAVIRDRELVRAIGDGKADLAVANVNGGVSVQVPDSESAL